MYDGYCGEREPQTPAERKAEEGEAIVGLSLTAFWIVVVLIWWWWK